MWHAAAAAEGDDESSAAELRQLALEAEELVPLQTEPEVQWEVVVVRDKRCPPEEEAEVVRTTPRSVQTHAAHEEPGAPGVVASMSRTSAYAPGVAHLPSALANY